MIFYLIAPVFIGFMSVLQIGLNKQLGQQYGLSLVLGINALMILLTSGLLFFATLFFASRFGPFLAGDGSTVSFKLWHLLPGLFGFSVIFGLPYCMNHVGALPVFIIFVTAQTIASMLWDLGVEKMPFVATKLLGAIIALIGVFLVAR
ncbi:MAG: DMT family transporter [Myxococcaceae bacterium]|nr:DMT family transporter [Myxococcaceae bacterium]MBH2006579.1 DMT family transporter [Myxococcaceae bacterium]